MRAGLVRAFHRHTWTNDLGQTVYVISLDAAPVFDALTHVLRPRFGAEDTNAQWHFLDVHAQFSGAFDDVQEIAWRAADGRDAEILHEHDLPVGVAAGDGDDASRPAPRAP